MILRLLGPQGIAGIAIAVALSLLLVLQKGETRHWKKQSSQFEHLYLREQAALAGTVANYRAAAEQARAADQANIARVAAQQRAINERTADDYQARIAAARMSAQRLRGQAASGSGDPRSGRAAPVPGVPAAAAGAAQNAGEDRFSLADRALATEQAIQLDELIKWVGRQAQVDPQGSR